MTTRETYDRDRDHWRFLRDAHLGGRFWREPSATTLGDAQLTWYSLTEDGGRVQSGARRRSYLVPHDGESDRKFDSRASVSSYVNIVAPVVKAYAEGTTSRVQRSLEVLGSFVEDVDRRGSAWGEFAESIATWAAVYGVVACVIDAPSSGVEGLSEAEREARGIAPYCVAVHPAAWAWIECDSTGRVLEFAYVDQPYQSASSNGAQTDVTLRVWRADRDGVPGGWETRSVSVLGGDSLSGVAGDVTASGPLSPVLAGEVPVTFAYYERDASAVCPQGISLVADVADTGRVIFNELSWALEIHQRAGFPFLAIPLKSTGGQLDSGTAVRVGTDQALGFDSGTGAPQWVSPSPESSRELRDHCAYLFQWAMRTAGLELAADASAQVQSGEALRVRSRDFESRALRFARNLQRWEVKTLRLLGAMAGLSPAEVESIEVTYPKRITLPDPSEDLARALTILTAPVEIGAEARALAVGQAVDAALSLSDEQLSGIVEDLRETYGADIETFAAKQTVERLRASREAEGFEAVQAADAARSPAQEVTSG